MQVGWGWIMENSRGGACLLFRFQRNLTQKVLSAKLALIGRVLAVRYHPPMRTFFSDN